VPKLYGELASWWPLLSSPDDYAEEAAFAYLLRAGDGSVRVESDRHTEGLFTRGDWLRILADVGFRPHVVPFDHSELEPGMLEVFVGTKPG
jgi:hypothetical protein